MKALEYNSMMKVLAVLALLLMSSGYVAAEEKAGHSQSSESKESKDMVTEKASDAYPLTVCPISGEPLDMMGDPIIYDYEGREIRFCCAGCVGAFEKDPEAGLAKVDAMIAAAKSDSMKKAAHHSGEKMKDASSHSDHKEKDAGHSEHKKDNTGESKKKMDAHKGHDHGSH